MRRAWPWHRLVWTALFLLCFAGPALALEGQSAQAPVNIEADSISYIQENDVYQASGHVTINFSGGTLQADSVSLERGANIATAEGRVVVRTDGDVLQGDKVVFDVTTNTGVIYAGKMFMSQNHFYLTGDRIEKLGEATYHIQSVSLTTCDGETPDWRIVARELNVTVDGYGTMKDGKFLARDMPLLYLPYFLFPAKTTRQTGLLLPRIAYSQEKLGADVELPFFWAVSDSADATLYQRYMEKRGFQEGVEFRYFSSQESYGTIYGDYLRDTAQITEQTDNLSRDWQEPQRRWSFYLQNYTALQPGLYLRSDIARVSDIWYFKDFSSHNYYLDHYAQKGEDRFKKVYFTADETLASLESKVRLVKDWSLYNFTALLDYTDNLASNNNEATLQKYPEISLAGVKQSFFGTPINIDFNVSGSHNYRGTGPMGNLADLQPVFSLPLNIGGAFHLTPEVAVRETLWQRNDDPGTEGGRQGSRTAYRFGLDATTSLSRDYVLPGKNVEKVRHEIKPELLYTYVPHVEQADVPDFADLITEQKTLAAAVTNTLIAKMKGKDGKTSYVEMLRFKLAQNIDMQEVKFGDVNMELDFKPMAYLGFSARNIFNVNDGRWDKVGYDLHLADVRGDNVSIGYRYTRDLAEGINLSLKAVLTTNFDLFYDLKRNELDHSYLDNSVRLSYTRQCWSVGLSYADTFNDRTFMLSLSLRGLGQSGEKK